MENKKVYLVKCSIDFIEYVNDWIEKAFLDKSKAEKFVDEYNNNLNPPKLLLDVTQERFDKAYDDAWDIVEESDGDPEVNEDLVIAEMAKILNKEVCDVGDAFEYVFHRQMDMFPAEIVEVDLEE